MSTEHDSVKEYLQNWERAGGILMTLGLIRAIVLFGGEQVIGGIGGIGVMALGGVIIWRAKVADQTSNALKDLWAARAAKRADSDHK